MADSAPDEVEPIAVVGLGCRFPGSATSPPELWQMLCRGESAWSEIPSDRLNISSYYHPSITRQGSIPFRGAHLLQQDVGAFDSSFFSIPADEAKAVDPQQRILLEVTVEALDNAGIDRSSLRGSDAGVWIGSFVKDYEQITLRDPDDSPMYGATGNGTAIMSNRISFFLDIHGPSMTIDTGCSASLVCVHAACQSLRAREVDVGLAGGAGLILTPNTMMPMTALNFLSPDGKCYTFDARANGYGRGEGVGVVVLKRLSDAIRDNDNIRAVIRGSRVNQDGRTPGITLPNPQAQVTNMRAVYQKSGVDIDKAAYVECHGTGTQAGDWRELKAVSDAFCSQRSKDNPIYVSSIKTNVGHLEGCAGVAGLIKGILTIENGIIPKHINFEAPGNPSIDFEDWRVKVPLENTPWPVEGLRRISVNSFGFGGTNAHVILDDAAHYLAQRWLTAHHNTTILEQTSFPSVSPAPALSDSYTHDLRGQIEGLPTPDSKPHLFVFSAHEQKVLSRVLQAQTEYLRERAAGLSGTFMEDLAYTLGCRRTKLHWRASVAASSPKDLLQKIATLATEGFIKTAKDKPSKIAFIFAGQGAQWFAMGRELLGFESFLQSIVRAATYLQDNLRCPFNLLEELLRDEHSSKINRSEVSQPATTAIQVALVDFLDEHYGAHPVSVCGHSSGEIAAAYALGAIPQEDAWELAYRRGCCVGALKASARNQNGRMLATSLSPSEAQYYVDKVGSGRAVVACINSPSSVTLSGDGDAILELQASLEANGVFSRMLVVDTAYHSPHMTQIGDEYLESIAHIQPREPSRAGKPDSHKQGTVANSDVLSATREKPIMYSSVTGDAIEWRDLSPAYWVENMLSPVLFADAMHKMMSCKSDQRPGIILEISPHSSLQGPIRQILDAEQKLKHPPAYFSMLTRNKNAALTALEAVGWLWNHGCSIVMPQGTTIRDGHPRRPRLLVDLPQYPWNHDNVYWHESHLSRANRFQVHGRYDLIGRPTADSLPCQPRWRGFFRVSENPWIRDHQVQKTIIYPAAGMIAMVLEAAKQLAPADYSGVEILQFKIQKAMIIPSTSHGLEHALNLTKQAGHAVAESNMNTGGSESTDSLTFVFSIHSKLLDGEWQEHGDGLVTIHCHQPTKGARAQHQFHKERNLQTQQHYHTFLGARHNCDEIVVPRQLYETLDVIGMNYGPLFQNIMSLHRKDDTCISTIRIPDTKVVMPASFEFPHIIHPATLDSIFQAAFAISSEPMVPSFLGSFYISADTSVLSQAGNQLVVHTHAERRRLREASASFVVSDESWLRSPQPDNNHPLIVIKDMCFTALTTSPDGVEDGGFLPNFRNLCSEIVWEPFVLPALPRRSLEITMGDSRGKEQCPSILLLIPEDISPGINRLCAEFAKSLDCQFRTPAGVIDGEALPSYCLSLLEADGNEHVWDWAEKDYAAFRTLFFTTKGLLWISRASQLESANPKCGLLQGLARTIHSEYPKKSLISFDVDPQERFTTTSTAAFARKITTLLHSLFFGPKTPGPKETEYIERNGEMMVSRLVPVRSLNTLIERSARPPEPELEPMPDPQSRPLKLKIGEIGKPKSLYWDDDLLAHLPLPTDEVKVRVITTSLSDLDVEIVQGRSRDHSLGTDVYGVVEETGHDVVDVTVGDYVVGVVRGSLRDYVRCRHELLHKVPQDEFQPSHVYLPTSFSVARYALANVQPGDNVLIHAGAGSFGQAAMQLAKFMGATVFASAKTNDQRGILHRYWNIPDTHIVDGTTYAFVDTILRLTDGKGVDVIYDPTGRNRDLNRKCIAEGGHIFSFAKKRHRGSVRASDAELTGKTYSVTILDIAYLIKQQPHRIGEALAFICPKVLSGRFKVWDPEPLKQYDYSELDEAFEVLGENGHSGQIYCQRPVSKAVRILPKAPPSAGQNLRAEATYVLSGGLGGLGVEVAKLLEANGARNIVFLSRSGATSEVAKSCVSLLTNRGVHVRIFQVDICEAAALGEVFDEIRRSMPPVKGVFQCAATLRDGLFENMTYEDWQVATRPKTIGSWNLHQTFPRDMDLFVFLSSSAGVIGNRGQANYAAGNAFQDSLARHINTTSQGTTHAVSLDLGPILGAGMVAEDPRTLDKLKASGFIGIRLQDFKRIVEYAITGSLGGGQKMPAQVVVGVGTGGLVRQNKPSDPYWTRTALFAHLNKIDVPTNEDQTPADGTGAEESVQRLLAEATDPDDAVSAVSKGLRVVLAKSMNMSAENVDESKRPSAYGVDSLVAVSVRNWVYRECEVDVSVFEVLSETSIHELSAVIVQRGGFGLDS